MNVLTLLSSARPKSNTARMLGWVEENLEAMGHQVQRIELFKKQINGCLGCAKCRENTTEPGCVQKDDAPAILDRMIKADAVVYAAPLYMWGFPAQIKAFMDRTYSLVNNYGSPDHSSLVEGQRQALLMTAAGGYENNGEGASDHLPQDRGLPQGHPGRRTVPGRSHLSGEHGRRGKGQGRPAGQTSGRGGVKPPFRSAEVSSCTSTPLESWTGPTPS